MKYIVVLTLSEEVVSFDIGGEELTILSSLHEALCRAIHEGDEKALAWLYHHVEDISVMND